MVGSDNINLEIEKKEEKIFTPVSPHMKIDASRFSRDHDIEKAPVWESEAWARAGLCD